MHFTHNISKVKSFLFSLLTYTTLFSYSDYCEWWLKKCRTPSQKDQTKVFCSSRNGKQGKQFSDESHWLLKLQCWKSPDALTVIQLLRLKFSNLLNHWLSSPQNKISPNSCDLFREVLPLTPLTVLGAIQMLDNFIKSVNKTDVPLHVFGGV